MNRDQSREFDVHAVRLTVPPHCPMAIRVVTCQDGTVRIRDVETGSEIGRLEHKRSVVARPSHQTGGLHIRWR